MSDISLMIVTRNFSAACGNAVDDVDDAVVSTIHVHTQALLTTKMVYLVG